jgi:hypothetical protein
VCLSFSDIVCVFMNSGGGDKSKEMFAELID